MAIWIECVRTGQRVEAGSDHQLEIALGEHDVGVLPVQHLALLGDANLALEGAEGLGEDSAMGWASAPADRTSAAMKEAQVNAAFARRLVQCAMGAEDLPGAGEHSAVFIRVGVAQHHLLT